MTLLLHVLHSQIVGLPYDSKFRSDGLALAPVAARGGGGERGRGG